MAVGASEIGSYEFDNYGEFRMWRIINYYNMSNENSTQVVVKADAVIEGGDRQSCAI